MCWGVLNAFKTVALLQLFSWREVSFFLILIPAVGQLPETLFGRVGERLLDGGPMLLEKTEENMQNSWKKDKQMLLEKMVLFLCQQIST